MKTPEPRMPLEAVAALAKLSISEEDVPALSADLEEILDFTRAIQAIDLNGVSETAHIIPVENVLREDTPAAPWARETMLRNAPTSGDAYITVPPTFARGNEA